jgi:hypothetical protein
MEAIEFKTILHNGTVAIPPQYLSQWEGKAIRVIVLDAIPVNEIVKLLAGEGFPTLFPCL